MKYPGIVFIPDQKTVLAGTEYIRIAILIEILRREVTRSEEIQIDCSSLCKGGLRMAPKALVQEEKTGVREL